MSFPTKTALALTLALTSTNCSNHSPTSPSSTLAISNLQARQLGLQHEVCGGPFDFNAQDELIIDVAGPASYVLGMGVSHTDTRGGQQFLGNVSECSADVTPCSAFSSVCLAKASATTSTVRVFARAPWTPERTWVVSFRKGQIVSNQLQATVVRPDQIPVGDKAGIAYLEAQRSGFLTATYSAVAYLPGIPGRQITWTQEVFSGGALVSRSSPFTFGESVTERRLTAGGGLRVPEEPFDVVVTIEERDAAGLVLVVDRRSITVR